MFHTMNDKPIMTPALSCTISWLLEIEIYFSCTSNFFETRLDWDSLTSLILRQCIWSPGLWVPGLQGRQGQQFCPWDWLAHHHSCRPTTDRATKLEPNPLFSIPFISKIIMSMTNWSVAWTYPSLASITVFVISGLQSVIYWKNFCHVWWVSYGLYVINCICTLMLAVFWHTCTFSGYINRLCRHTVELYCVSWIYYPIIC